MTGGELQSLYVIDSCMHNSFLTLRIASVYLCVSSGTVQNFFSAVNATDLAC